MMAAVEGRATRQSRQSPPPPADGARGSASGRSRRPGSRPQAPCLLTDVSRKATVDPQDRAHLENPCPHVEILRPVTRQPRTARVAEQAIRELDEALAWAMGDLSEPGPVYLESIHFAAQNDHLLSHRRIRT
jgi:hypothetical protein